MIGKYDDAPEQVRKLAFSVMHLYIQSEFQTYDDLRALQAVAAKAGVNAATLAQGLRSLAEQELKHVGERRGVISLGSQKRADLYLDFASRIEAKLTLAGAVLGDANI